MRMCRVLLVIVITVTMSLVLVWQQHHITRMGYRISSLQKRKIDLTEDNRLLEHKINKLISGDRISQVINSFDLNLVSVHNRQNDERQFAKASFHGGSFVR